MPTGRTIKLGVPCPRSTERLKQVIYKEEGIHPYRQQLTFNGRVLEDGPTFDEYNVEGGSTLDLVIRPGSKYVY